MKDLKDLPANDRKLIFATMAATSFGLDNAGVIKGPAKALIMRVSKDNLDLDVDSLIDELSASISSKRGGLGEVVHSICNGFREAFVALALEQAHAAGVGPDLARRIVEGTASPTEAVSALMKVFEKVSHKQESSTPDCDCPGCRHERGERLGAEDVAAIMRAKGVSHVEAQEAVDSANDALDRPGYMTQDEIDALYEERVGKGIH